MLEKVGKVSNPLTVIAIFAGISEISGTIVLPKLSEYNQFVFIWFVMLFPVILISAFFYVLWHKHRVLYSPSDYKEDASFLISAGSMKYNDSNIVDNSIATDSANTSISYLNTDDNTPR